MQKTSQFKEDRNEYQRQLNQKANTSSVERLLEKKANASYVEKEVSDLRSLVMKQEEVLMKQEEALAIYAEKIEKLEKLTPLRLSFQKGRQRMNQASAKRRVMSSVRRNDGVSGKKPKHTTGKEV